MEIVWDCETDDLLPYTSKIHCISVLETATGNIKTYTEREEFVRDSEQWTHLISFNGVGFDHYVLWLLWNLPFAIGPDTFNGRPVKITDCLVLSRYQHADRNGGAHSLEKWGEVLGFPKLDHKDFTAYSDDMRRYCENDVLLTHEVYKALIKEQRNT